MLSKWKDPFSISICCTTCLSHLIDACLAASLPPQSMLSKWEERLFAELETVSELQSPTARSLLQQQMARTPY